MEIVVAIPCSGAQARRTQLENIPLKSLTFPSGSAGKFIRP